MFILCNRKSLELKLHVESHLKMCVLSCLIVLLISKKHCRKSDDSINDT